MNYLSAVHGYKPENPIDVHRGEAIAEAVLTDFFWKMMPTAVWMPPSPERDEKFEAIGVKYQESAGHLARILS